MLEEQLKSLDELVDYIGAEAVARGVTTPEGLSAIGIGVLCAEIVKLQRRVADL